MLVVVSFSSATVVERQTSFANRSIVVALWHGNLCCNFAPVLCCNCRPIELADRQMGGSCRDWSNRPSANSDCNLAAAGKRIEEGDCLNVHFRNRC